jgi:hypothetical protein
MNKKDEIPAPKIAIYNEGVETNAPYNENIFSDKSGEYRMMEVFLQTWESKKASLMRSHLSKSLVQ